jgi:hypothetical protein
MESLDSVGGKGNNSGSASISMQIEEKVRRLGNLVIMSITDPRANLSGYLYSGHSIFGLQSPSSHKQKSSGGTVEYSAPQR